MLWEGSDLAALGVASFGHVGGVHYQNAPHQDDYLREVEAGRLPLARGLVATPRELLIRQLVLGLKRGRLDTTRLTRLFGIDPLVAWAPQWQSLAEEGCIDSLGPPVVLSRRGLLRVDALLPRFFEPLVDGNSAVSLPSGGASG